MLQTIIIVFYKQWGKSEIRRSAIKEPRNPLYFPKITGKIGKFSEKGQLLILPQFPPKIIIFSYPLMINAINRTAQKSLVWSEDLRIVVMRTVTSWRTL